MISIGHGLYVDETEFIETFLRASGAGGQNVNKVETAVQLRFDLHANRTLPHPVKARAARLAGHRLTKDGVIVIAAQRFRTQDRNRADARERLIDLLREAGEPPPPPRRATRPTLGSVRRRLEGKKVRAGVKAGRGRPDREPD